MKNPIAFLSHDFTHHLDHLAPLCYILGCPLIVDHPLTYKMGKEFYPQVDIRLEEPINLFFWAQNTSLILLSTKNGGRELKASFSAMGKDNIRFCFCPHGQSDKGYRKQELDPFYHQDVALLYGKKMEAKHSVLQTIRDTVTVGNYRLWFFEQFQKEYRNLFNKTLPKLQKSARYKYLFAPTWQDGENPSSFFDKTEQLIKALPKHIHLIVKLHPLLGRQAPALVTAIEERYQSLPNVDILLHYPLIYPLLAGIDVYIGDYSSIGYDFLYFNKPMFFFASATQQTSLHQCGIRIPSKESSIFSFIQSHLDQETLAPKKSKLYNHSFAKFHKENFLNSLSKVFS